MSASYKGEEGGEALNCLPGKPFGKLVKKIIKLQQYK